MPGDRDLFQFFKPRRDMVRHNGMGINPEVESTRNSYILEIDIVKRTNKG